MQRERYENLDAAMFRIRELADQISEQDRLDEIKALRNFEPARRVAARLELSRGGWFRHREAGVDVMGNGSVVPYIGSIRRRRINPEGGAGPWEALRAAMEG